MKYTGKIERIKREVYNKITKGITPQGFLYNADMTPNHTGEEVFSFDRKGGVFLTRIPLLSFREDIIAEECSFFVKDDLLDISYFSETYFFTE